MTTSGCMFALEASSALSDFRAERLLADLKSVYPQVKAVSGRYIHFVHAARALEEQEVSRLRALLSYGFEGADAAADAEFLVIPRLGTISPWASKATDIVHNCGMTEVLRVERGIRYAVAFEGAAPASDILEAIASKLHDRMTESVVPSDFPVEKLFTELPGKPMSVISASTPEEAHRELARANAEMGLALSDGEMDYLEKGLQHDGIGSDTANDLHALPDGLGDERNNRVRQAQQTFQNGHQRVTGAAQLRLGTAVHYRLGQLQIPVAELVPGELVQNACGNIEAEAVQRFAVGFDGLVEFRQDPAVRQRQGHLAAVKAAILIFGIHQHKAAGVPQLVAEVTVTFQTLHIPVDIAAGRGQRRQGKAQGVGTVRLNAVRELLLGAFGDFFRQLRLHHVTGAFFQQLRQGNAVDHIC